MTIRLRYDPNYALVGDAAREGAAGIARRQNIDKTIGRTQEQQQFDTQIQQRDAAMRQQAREQEADRQFRGEAIQFQAAQAQQEQQAQNAEWQQRLRMTQEAEQQQEELQ